MSEGYTSISSDDLGEGIAVRRRRLRLNTAGNAEELNQPVDVATPSAPAAAKPFEVIALSTVRSEATTWLWPNFIPGAAITMLSGSLGGGKTQLLFYLAAQKTTGENRWPHPLELHNGRQCEPEIVLFMIAEDSTAQSIRPRLLAAGADLDRCAIVKLMQSENGKRSPITLSLHMERLEATIDQIEAGVHPGIKKGRVGMVCIDPVTSFTGSSKIVDTHKANDVRTIVSPLQDIAERRSIPFILITHVSKYADRPENAFIGSQAWIAQARAGYIVIPELNPDTKRETGRVLFMPGRPPSDGPMPPTLAFRKLQRFCGDRDPKTGADILASYVEWDLTGTVDITANEAMEASRPTRGRRPRALNEAVDFLKEILANGPMAAKDVLEAAGARVISKDAIKQAKKTLKVVDEKERGKVNGGWIWSLPHPDTSEGAGND